MQPRVFMLHWLLMNEVLKRPIVGVGVIVQNADQVLLGLRHNAHGEGTWSFPGGHLEFGESIIDCARREVLEETGLQIEEFTIGSFTNDYFQNEQKHYVTLFVVGKYAGGRPLVMEPDKCSRWKWFDWNNLPRPLFLPIQNLLVQGFTF